MGSSTKRTMVSSETQMGLAGDPARRSFDAAAALSRATDLPTLNLTMRRALEPLGFKYFVVVENFGHDVRQIAGAPHPEWHPHLIERGYHLQGPAYTAAARRLGPCFHSDLVDLADYGEVQRRIEGERREFGITDGFSNSMPGSNGWTLTVGMTGADIDTRDPDVRIAAHILSSYFGLSARRLRTPVVESVKPVMLTERQRDCLRWVREGKSATDIASILGISAHTVHEHVAGACRRLDVRTRIQAVTAAICLNLIDP